jgi:soluble lytic murein transglycosylase-like protein
MATEQAILREYLVALGWRVNTADHKKALGTVSGMDKRLLGLGKTVVSVGTAVVTMSTLFARQMERLYYASRYAGTTAENLQAAEYGFKNIGLEGGKATAVLKGFSAAIRSNPGLIGLLNSLGVAVKGRDKADVLVDLVAALRKMPFYVAERYASLFGLDAETLFNMQEGLEELKRAAELRKQMAADMGVDADQAARVGKEYMNLWREVVERAGLFGQVLTIALQGPVKDLLGATNQLLTDWSAIVREINNAGTTEFWKKMREGAVGGADREGVKLTPDARERLGLPLEDIPYTAPEGNKGLGKMLERYLRWRDRRSGRNAYKTLPPLSEDSPPPPGMTAEEWERRNKHAVPVDSKQPKAALELSDEEKLFAWEQQNKDSAPPGMSPEEWERRNREARPVDEPGSDDREKARALFSRLEKKYALPDGLLDRVWKKESDRGRHRVSPKGAEGHFQFMPETQKEYGLVDPYDLEESADAAARKYSDLIKRYKGDTRMAAAAYNWGDGNLARYGLGRAPTETRDYMDAVAGPAPTLNQDTTINVYGVSDPKEAADHVARNQQAVNASLVRNYAPKVR